MLKSIGERNLVIDKKKRKKNIQEKKRDPNTSLPLLLLLAKFTRIARESRSLRDADPLEGVGVAREILVTA